MRINTNRLPEMLRNFPGRPDNIYHIQLTFGDIVVPEKDINDYRKDFRKDFSQYIDDCDNAGVKPYVLQEWVFENGVFVQKRENSFVRRAIDLNELQMGVVKKHGRNHPGPYAHNFEGQDPNVFDALREGGLLDKKIEQGYVVCSADIKGTSGDSYFKLLVDGRGADVQFKHNLRDRLDVMAFGNWLRQYK